MRSLLVIGLQWGDEGKGKVVNLAKDKYNVGIRFNGGNNAGHTVITNNRKYVFSCLPSMAIGSDSCSILTNGIALNPWKLKSEIEYLGDIINPKNIIISGNAHIIIPEVHCSLDDKKNSNIGSTRMGVGPCYSDKVQRIGLRLFDIFHMNDLHSKIDNILDFHRMASKDLFNTILENISKIHHIAEFMRDELIICDYIKENNIILEGSQGALLDVNTGTYPYVTSSGILPPSNIIHKDHTTIGIVKIYSTRVGNGPMVGSMCTVDNRIFVEHGHEVGTVTGRERRCGWLDLVQLKSTCKILNVDAIVITKIDVIQSTSKMRMCVGYEDGYKPCYSTEYKDVKSIYKDFPIWNHDITEVKKWNDMPSEAIDLIEFISEFIGVPVIAISNGPEDTAIVRNTACEISNYI